MYYMRLQTIQLGETFFWPDRKDVHALPHTHRRRYLQSIDVSHVYKYHIIRYIMMCIYIYTYIYLISYQHHIIYHATYHVIYHTMYHILYHITKICVYNCVCIYIQIHIHHMNMPHRHRIHSCMQLCTVFIYIYTHLYKL